MFHCSVTRIFSPIAFWKSILIFMHLYFHELWSENLDTIVQISKKYFVKTHLHKRIYRTCATITRSWFETTLETIHKVRILQKKLLEKTFLPFKNGVKSIQTAGYNGAHTVVLRSTQSFCPQKTQISGTLEFRI